MIFFELFYTFFLIGLFTFGGGYAMIPMIQEQVVAKGWATLGELTDFIAISEITPGPFAINIATFVGSKAGGILGSTCATIGVILPSLIIIIIVAFILSKFLKNKYVQGALNGIKPVALALILSTVILLFIKLMFFNNGALYQDFYFDLKSFTLLIILIGLIILFKKKLKKQISPIMLICFSAILGIIIFI